MSVIKTILMFSGQGSQYFHMGRELFDTNNTFRQWMLRLDGLVRDLSGESVIEAVYAERRSRSDTFDRTLLTHPAIFMVEYSLAQSLIEANIVPDVVLGASLGSFTAATLAGCIDVEAAMTAVVKQATALEACCEPGGMLAVLSDPALFAEDFLCSRSELAGINFASHFVISARQSQLAVMEAELQRRNVIHQRLPVSFAFHSQWIDDAQAPFRSFMRSLRPRRAALPLACCDRANVIPDLSDDYFWSVARQPIRFKETLALLEQSSASSGVTHRYIDAGPAGTLATFVKYGLPATSRSTVHSVLTPFGQDQRNLSNLLALYRPPAG